MVHRVFGASEVDCLCIIEESGSGLLRAPALRISRSEVLLDTSLPLKEGLITEVILELGGRRSLVQKAQVLSSGTGHLRLKWLFSRYEDEDRFEDTLVAYAGHETPVRGRIPVDSRRPRSRSLDPEPRSGAPESAPAKPRSDSRDSVWIDGRLDIEATLRQRSRRIAVSRIAAQQKSVRVLDLSTITALIQEAVEDAMENLQGSEEERRQLLEETEKAFAERLAAFKEEKADLESRTSRLESELARAEKMLSEERRNVISADRFTVSDDGLAKLEMRFSRLLERSIKTGSLNSKMKNELRGLVAELLDEERAKISETARAAHSDRTKLLERKISRLVRSLDETRAERDSAREHAHALQSAPSFSVSSMFPGISRQDPLREEKLALLSELVEENQELRKHLRSKPVG